MLTFILNLDIECVLNFKKQIIQNFYNLNQSRPGLAGASAAGGMKLNPIVVESSESDVIMVERSDTSEPDDFDFGTALVQTRSGAVARLEEPSPKSMRGETSLSQMLPSKRLVKRMGGGKKNTKDIIKQINSSEVLTADDKDFFLRKFYGKISHREVITQDHKTLAVRIISCLDRNVLHLVKRTKRQLIQTLTIPSRFH